MSRVKKSKIENDIKKLILEQKSNSYILETIFSEIPEDHNLNIPCLFLTIYAFYSVTQTPYAISCSFLDIQTKIQSGVITQPDVIDNIKLIQAIPKLVVTELTPKSDQILQGHRTKLVYECRQKIHQSIED